jgi:cell division protein FtsI (penicillin-binding protein 3)/stage V sporulation protein D (sporulation-specific penicillin-binding protein)
MKYSPIKRTTIFSVFILAFAFILMGRLFSLQIVKRSFYVEAASRQYATPSSDLYERGNIFFKHKNGDLVSAAGQITGYKVAINPEILDDPQTAYKKISEISDLDESDFLEKAAKTGDPYEEILNNLTKENADKISALKIQGVSIFKEKRRFYPGVNMAAQTLGFVGYKGDELGGRYGLERQYEETLSRNKNTPYVNFFAEVFSNIKRNILKDSAREGDIVTTIEPSVQSFLDSELAKVRDRYNVDSIGGIIMNPKDGSIYAITVKPDFDLNNFSKVKNATTFSNPMVENVLEFGSVVKPLIMASALDAKVVTAQTSYNDTGSVIVENKQIYNFDKKGRGPGTTMQEVLNDSLNTGMVYVYQRLGKQKMRDYLFSFGIKEKTGIDLPNETSGLVSNLNSPRDIEYANAAFGQGIALTPVELLRALASLGNGGELVVPHLVERIKYSDGTAKVMSYEKKPTKISKETSEEITRMLVAVMDTSLKGGTGKLEHHSIAVKTGTAQVANATTGGYYEDRHNHSFFGYFPAYDPEFIVLLYAINPKGTLYASQTWADPFLNIAKFLINYYEVPPDR